MNNTTVPEEATGMRNLDSARPSPMVEAFVKMLDTQVIAEADRRVLTKVLEERVGGKQHASWCVKDVSDEDRGMVCSSDTVEVSDADETAFLGIDGTPAEPILSIDLGRKDADDEIPWMLFVTPEVAHTVSRLIRGAGQPTADALDALIAQAEAAREAV